MKRFADSNHIEYPLLCDKGSAVIRRYGILNTNVPEDHMFYGIPYPGMYLLGADGVVRDKFFLPDYQTRPTGSEVLTRAFGVRGNNAFKVKSENVEAAVTLSDIKAVPGQALGVALEFAIAPGWHIYGQPLPSNYVATSVTFASDVIGSQTLDLPAARPMNFKSLGETLPVYEGKFGATGTAVVKLGLKPGKYQLHGTLKFQECSEEVCNLPFSAEFDLPLTVEALAFPQRS